MAGIDPNYVDVAERIREFQTKHPDGSLQQVTWGVQDVGGKTFIHYTAAAYRTPDDERPGIGTAWEPFPGPTAFTRDSELMNAETSAWGRAIVAALASETKRIATVEDVRNRQGATPGLDAAFGTAVAGGPKPTPDKGVQAVADAFAATPVTEHPPISQDHALFEFKFGKYKGQGVDAADDGYLEWLLKQPAKPGYEQQHVEQQAIYRTELERRAAVAA